MSREGLLRDIREIRISFMDRYGRPMTNDEIRTLELAEKLAGSITETTIASFRPEWMPEQDHRPTDEYLVAMHQQP